jgi:hypothetical protein
VCQGGTDPAPEVRPARGLASGPVKLMFVTYVVVILAGLAMAIAVGLTYN